MFTHTESFLGRLSRRSIKYFYYHFQKRFPTGLIPFNLNTLLIRQGPPGLEYFFPEQIEEEQLRFIRLLRLAGFMAHGRINLSAGHPFPVQFSDGSSGYLSYENLDWLKPLGVSSIPDLVEIYELETIGPRLLKYSFYLHATYHEDLIY